MNAYDSVRVGVHVCESMCVRACVSVCMRE